MKIKEIKQSTQEYSALIYLYNEATKNSGDDPSDDIELAFETLDHAIDLYEELTAELSRYFTLALKRDSKWSTGLSKEEEKELVNIEYKIIEMISENQL